MATRALVAARARLDSSNNQHQHQLQQRPLLDPMACLALVLRDPDADNSDLSAIDRELLAVLHLGKLLGRNEVSGEILNDHF